MEIYHFSFQNENEWHEKKWLLKYLNPLEQERVCRLYQDKHKLAKLYSLLFQRYILAKSQNIAPSSISYSFNEKGKPKLNSSTLHFNLSNSGKHIVIALDNQEIGIDIEESKNVDLDIVDRFFSHSEKVNIYAHQDPEKRFFEYWALKEAFLKCIGTGLSKPLSSFTVMSVNHSTSSYRVETDEKHYFLSLFYINSHLPLGICSTSPFELPSVISISGECLEAFYKNSDTP